MCAYLISTSAYSTGHVHFITFPSNFIYKCQTLVFFTYFEFTSPWYRGGEFLHDPGVPQKFPCRYASFRVHLQHVLKYLCAALRQPLWCLILSCLKGKYLYSTVARTSCGKCITVPVVITRIIIEVNILDFPELPDKITLISENSEF